MKNRDSILAAPCIDAEVDDDEFISASWLVARKVLASLIKLLVWRLTMAI